MRSKGDNLRKVSLVLSKRTTKEAWVQDVEDWLKMIINDVAKLNTGRT